MPIMFPNVNNCSAGKCVYNYSGKCCTMAINVGGPEPLCDTYSAVGKKGGFEDLMARVGACKVDNCMHNKSYECMADSVEMIFSGERAECGNFQPIL